MSKTLWLPLAAISKAALGFRLAFDVGEVGSRSGWAVSPNWGTVGERSNVP